MLQFVVAIYCSKLLKSFKFNIFIVGHFFGGWNNF